MIEQPHTTKNRPLKPFFTMETDSSLFKKILTNTDATINEKTITSFDFYSIPKNISKEELINCIKKHLKVENLNEKLELISECFKEAKEYILSYLHQDIPNMIKKIDKFSSVDKFIDFVNNTKTREKNDNLGFIQFYCAILTTMSAIWECKKQSYNELQQYCESLYNSMFEPKKENDGVEEKLYFIKGKKYCENNTKWEEIFLNTEKPISSFLTYRGKEFKRIITKILTNPEIDANKIVKDGIGLKFEINNPKDINNVVNHLILYFSKFEAVEEMIFEDYNLLDFLPIDKENFIENLKKRVNVEIVDKDQKISRSNKKYQAIKLRGVIVRKNHNNREEKKQNIEIQIVLIDNKNERNLLRHEVYEAKQKLSAYTRLFGSFNEKYLDIICREAANNSKLCFDKIKNHIKENFIYKVISENKRSKEASFACRDHIDRLVKTNMLSGIRYKISKSLRKR